MIWLAVGLAGLHYLTLALGLGGLFMRGIYLRRLRASPNDAAMLASVFSADTAWGLAALLWIATGLARVFGRVEKQPDFYLRNGFFWIKMTLFLAVFLVELWPMITFIRWRAARSRGGSLAGLANLPAFVRINDVELALVLAIPFVAAAMARGLWLF